MVFSTPNPTLLWERAKRKVLSAILSRITFITSSRERHILWILRVSFVFIGLMDRRESLWPTHLQNTSWYSRTHWRCCHFHFCQVYCRCIEAMSWTRCQVGHYCSWWLQGNRNKGRNWSRGWFNKMSVMCRKKSVVWLNNTNVVLWVQTVWAFMILAMWIRCLLVNGVYQSPNSVMWVCSLKAVLSAVPCWMR